MLEKIYNLFFGLCLLGGIILAIGTAGASDCNLIEFSQIVRQIIVSAGLMLIGFFGLKVNEDLKNEN